MTSRLGIYLMQKSAGLPLSWVRAIGWLLGQMLFVLVPARRHVVLTNLRLCFPELSERQRQRLARRTFVAFGQSWMDRGWLWHAPAETVARRLKVHGALEELDGDAPTVLFGPHFYGLDAAATAIAMRVPRRYTSIYSQQADPEIDRWIKSGRLRFGDCRVFPRNASLKELVGSLRQGDVFYLLPDMDFGPAESVFVPFCGVPTATVPSLSRFARLGRAKVLTVLPRMTPEGYTVELSPAWRDFPSGDAVEDAALMNRRLEAYIADMPEQYYWVHKRFKTRPEGEPGLY